jgi:hypothetical protein
MKEVSSVAENSPERRTIDFGDHWMRIILIILLAGALDGFIRTALLPSKDEFREFYYNIARGSAKYPTITAAEGYLRLLVGTYHFLLDTVILTPAVILRFFIVRRPLFQFQGFFLTSIVITALAGIVLFSRGFEVMGKNLGIFLVTCALYCVLSSPRKR